VAGLQTRSFLCSFLSSAFVQPSLFTLRKPKGRAASFFAPTDPSKLPQLPAHCLTPVIPNPLSFGGRGICFCFLSRPLLFRVVANLQIGSFLFASVCRGRTSVRPPASLRCSGGSSDPCLSLSFSLSLSFCPSLSSSLSLSFPSFVRFPRHRSQPNTLWSFVGAFVGDASRPERSRRASCQRLAFLCDLCALSSVFSALSLFLSFAG